MKTAIQLAVLFSCVLGSTSAFGARDEIVFDKTGVEPQTYLYEMPEMCYRGHMSTVPELLRDLMKDGQSILHRDQGIPGIRFGHSKLITFEEQFFETSEEFREIYESESPKAVKAWDSYDVTSKTVLVLSDLGPQGDGTELYITEIKPCAR
jgi:hypothetical protein